MRNSGLACLAEHCALMGRGQQLAALLSRQDGAFLAAKMLQPGYNHTARYLLIRRSSDLLSAVIAILYGGLGM